MAYMVCTKVGTDQGWSVINSFIDPIIDFFKGSHSIGLNENRAKQTYKKDLSEKIPINWLHDDS